MWHIPEYIDPSSVDQNWKPPTDKPFVYHFLSQHTNTESKRISVGVSGVTYTVPGATDNQIIFDSKVVAIPVMSRWSVPDNIDPSSIDFTWHPNAFDPPFIYHFPSQWQSSSGVTYTVPGATEIKFIKDFEVKSIADMSKWYIPENIDTSNFDFTWHPNSLDAPYEYRFPTQHQKEGGPVYKGSAGIKWCNHQSVVSGSTQIFYMDFMNPGSKEQLEKLQKQYPTIKSTRYVDNHLTVFKRIMNLATTEFVWIISSVCDYSDFDFTWHPDGSQAEMVQCFPSGTQKRGDTFYIHVQSFKNQMYTLELLDWFNVINYIKDKSVPRFEMPVHEYNGDNLVSEVRNYNFTTPYAVFTNQQDAYPNFYPCLWTEKDRIVEAFTRSNSICAIPRDLKAYLHEQIYDYPHISDHKNRLFFAETPLDIVYISNGETNEEENYNWLINNTNAKNHAGKIHWVRGINGRHKAYHEAARRSTTPWFFAVFAKLRVDPNFDFTWQPDYFQEPKHYIFHAKNPVNGLIYGHQALIVHNKKLTLDAGETELRIDFTMADAHEVVPILSGVAEFNQNELMTWRTAFREVLKLKYFNDTTPSIDAGYRLKKWLSVAEGNFADWCLRGANDAVEYYQTLTDDNKIDKIKLSYEWDWLKQYYESKYGLL